MGDNSKLFTPILLTFLFGCNSPDGMIRGYIGHFGSSSILTVEKAYRSHGRWNDYVQNLNSSFDRYHQPDVACVGNEAGGVNSCIHSGEILKVVVSGRSSCSGLSIIDVQNFFDWVCNAQSGVATFYSRGLKPTVRLGALLNPTSWKPNQVLVYDQGTVINFSESVAWWSNPVVPLPDNSATSAFSLTTAGTIYTVATTHATSGYNINADRVALVILPGVSLLNPVAIQDSCNSGTGEMQGADRRVAICTGGQKFLWVEGDLALNNQDIRYGVLAVNTSFSVFRKLSVNRAFDVGLYLRNTYANSITDLDISNTWVTPGSPSEVFAEEEFGINIFNSSHDAFKNITVTSSAFTGIQLQTGTNLLFYNLRLSNNRIAFDARRVSRSIVNRANITNNIGRGLNWADNCLENIFTDIVGTGNRQGTIVIDGSNNFGSARNVIGFFTATGAIGDFGNVQINSSENTLFQAVSGHANFANFFFSGTAAANNITKVAGAHTGYALGFGSTTGVNNVFGDIIIGSVSGCIDASTSGSIDSNCNSPSTSPVVTGASLVNSFAFGLSTDEVINTSDTGGYQLYDSIADWDHFTSFYRGWARPYTGDLQANAGHCQSPATCQIWDLRALNSDTLLRNKSGNMLTANQAFVNGAACPSAVNQAINSSGHTFLLNAKEIMLDSVGNDNGLCESGERCTYAPNIGAYQGEGSLASSCVFTNGTVSNVQMYNYATTGI